MANTNTALQAILWVGHPLKMLVDVVLVRVHSASQELPAVQELPAIFRVLAAC